MNEVRGDVVGTELDDEYGAAVYQVDILANDGSLHEVEVDASGGDILSHTTEDQDDAAETRSLQERTSVSWEDAERSALGRFPGEVQGIELDDEDGRSCTTSRYSATMATCTKRPSTRRAATSSAARRKAETARNTRAVSTTSRCQTAGEIREGASERRRPLAGLTNGSLHRTRRRVCERRSLLEGVFCGS